MDDSLGSALAVVPPERRATLAVVTAVVHLHVRSIGDAGEEKSKDDRLHSATDPVGGEKEGDEMEEEEKFLLVS